MAQLLKQSTACTIMFGPFVDKADGVTLKTDSTTITDIDHASTGIFLSKAGAAAAIRHATVTASVADAYGMMKVTLDTTDTGTLGMLDVLFAKAATYLPVHKSFMVVPANIYDSLVAGSDLVDVSVTQLGGVAQSLTDLKDFADDGYDPSTNKVQGVVLVDTTTALTAPTAATIAAAVWDLDATTHQTTGTFGQAIGDPGADTHTIYGAVVTDAAGVNVAADIIAIKAETASIQTDTNDIQTRLPAALTAGGVMKTDALYSGGQVWIDTGGGAAGTTNYTHGTVINPNSSIANARTIADSLNLNIFNVSNGSSVTLDQGYTNYQFKGERWTLALASRAIPGTHFQGAIVSGLSTGTGTEWDDCSIGTVTIANDSTFQICGMSGTFTCQAAGIYNFIGCASSTAAGVDWILDFAALGATTVALRDWRGGVEVRNMAAGDVLAVTGAGRVTLAASCTAGTVLIAGLIDLVNNGSGQTISDGSRWNEDQRLANVTLVDTLTTYTGNTLQTADVATLIATVGAAGAGLTAADDAVIAAIGALNDLSTGDVADAVWDAAMADHLDVGSTGAALAAAGSAGDPWLTPIPGAYIAGQAGYIVGNNLDAKVSESVLDTAQPSVTFAALTVTGALTVSDGLIVNAATTNRAGVAIAGNGTAPGMFVAGGSTGDGIRAESGISGSGKVGISAVGHGTAGVGMKAAGTAAGAGLSAVGGDDGPGILATGGATSGSGLKAIGGGGGVGIEAGGTGTSGHGISAYAGGGVSGHGISAVSGSGAAGSGINAASTSANGAGLSVLGNGGGQGFLATGGASGDGIRAISPTAGNGMSLEGIGGVDLLLSTPTTNLDDAVLTAIADLPTNSELATALGTADDAVIAAIGALNDFDPAVDVVARVTLVDTTTTNTDMRGTDGAASQVSVDDLPTNAELATALGTADDAVIAAIGALNDFNPTTDEVLANVKKINGTTVNGNGSSTPWGP